MSEKLLQVERERKLIAQRKQHALDECMIEEHALEELKKQVSIHTHTLKQTKDALQGVETQIQAHTNVCNGLRNEILTLTRERDVLVNAMEIQKSSIEEDILTRTARKDEVEKEIRILNTTLDSLKQEVGSKQEALKQISAELLEIMKSVDEEREKHSSLVIAQEQEKQELRDQKDSLVRRGEELQKTELEVYTLRSNLSIIKDRYAEFARTHHLPFNV